MRCRGGGQHDTMGDVQNRLRRIFGFECEKAWVQMKLSN